MSFDDTPIAPTASKGADNSGTGSKLDSGARGAAILDAADKPAADKPAADKPAIDAAPTSTSPSETDSSASAGNNQAPDGAADSEPAPVLLFPIRCKAPWEDTTKYHPTGYDAPKVHGLESNLNKDNCASCHGDKLEGCANSPSCDNCHDGGHRNGWRKDCDYCHGGDDDDLGAPPRDIDGNSAEAMLSFRPHTVHVTTNGNRHRAYECETCHLKYQDALDLGHMYDDTPEKAEVSFAAGISKEGSYTMSGRCGNIYCHGDGRTPKAVEHTDPELTCSGCHSETPASGAHATHSFGFWCSECHGATVDDAMKISGPDNHVNGKVNLTMPSNNMQYDGKTCTGLCHLIVYHSAWTWKNP